jgi:hypothetical protein
MSDSSFCIHSIDGESEDEFMARVDTECLAAFGSFPNDWPEERNVGD